MSLPGWIVLSVFVLIAALEIIIPVIYVGIPILRERRNKKKGNKQCKEQEKK